MIRRWTQIDIQVVVVVVVVEVVVVVIVAVAVAVLVVVLRYFFVSRDTRQRRKFPKFWKISTKMRENRKNLKNPGISENSDATRRVSRQRHASRQ